MTQAICDITTDEVNVDVVVEPQADTMIEVANRAGGMEQVFHDNTLIGNGNSVDLGVNTDIIATKEYVDENKVDAYTKTEVDNKFTVANAQIDANATAIQKTRDDMNEEDGRLQTQITAHAAAITALQNEQTATGNQIQTIESKIPDGTSDTNPLINKQQLLDEEMDIREDLNSGLSELQTQITAQAAAIAGKQDELIAGENITIVDNVISATGGGGGGGIANVVHDTTLSGSGTDTSPLGLAETIKDEIASKAPTATVDALTAIVNDILTTYLKKTGDTMTGALNVPEFTVSTAEGTLSISIVAGVPVIASNNGMDIASRVKFDYAPTTDDTTAWADVNSTALVTKQQVAAALSTAGGGASLPDQAGNAGKFLKTDGATTSWANALENIAPEEYGSIVVGSGATTSTSARGAVVIGRNAGRAATGSGAVAIGDGAGNTSSAANSVSIGANAQAGSGTSAAIAIGAYAQAIAKNAIQLGMKSNYSGYTNSDTNTFKVGNANGNFEMMSADGTIPAERMSAVAGVTGQVLTKTDTGMAWQDTSGGDGDIDCGVMS